MTIKLFEDKIRTDVNPAKHIDNTYNFYDRSNAAKMKIARDKLNEWFDNYPQSEKEELKNRFKVSFSSCFFELFLHEFFIKQGFKLHIHPTLPDSTKKPDYLAEKDGIEFYIEAKESIDKSEAEQSIENRISLLYDTLNKIDSPNFFLRINEILLKTQRQPNGKKASLFIQTQLKKINPDEVVKSIALSGFDNLPTIEYDEDDLKIIVSVIPKSTELRGKAGVRPIGIYPSATNWGGSDESIKSAFEKKAGRYGNLDKPYIICINATSIKGTDDYSVMNALFGSLMVTWSTDPNNKDERYERGKDGLFSYRETPLFTRVSGVFITSVNIANIHTNDHWLVKNPNSAKDLSFDLFDLSYLSVNKKKITKTTKKSLKDVLGLTENWLVP